MSIIELYDVLKKLHRPKPIVVCDDPVYELQYGDAPNWRRPWYNSWYHTLDKIGILSGSTSHLDVMHNTHSCHNQLITDIEIEFIRKNAVLPDDPAEVNWKTIKAIMKDPEKLWEGRSYCPTQSKKQFKWVANVQGKYTEVPNDVNFMFYHIQPYFPQRTPNIAIHLTILLKAFGYEYRYIPCDPHPKTKKKAFALWDKILSDYDRNGLLYS